ADQDFHETIIRASRNKVINRLNHIGNVLIRTYPKGIILPLEESLEDHAKIIRAFKSRDGFKAEDLIRLHSRKAINILYNELLQEEKQYGKDVSNCKGSR
nr:FCD domain-containing protein [Bacteroidales bacterium]